MWEKKVALNNSSVNCVSVALCPNPHDADNLYTWSAGTTTFDGTVNTVFLAQLNDVAGGGADCFANHCDWRLPTREELQAIVDYDHKTVPPVDVAFHDTACGPSCTDEGDPTCSCTVSASYWSSATVALGTGNAWFVSFLNGSVAFGNKPNVSYARGVRKIP